MSSDAAVALKRLDAFFEAMPEDEALAEAEGLATHPFWAEARTLAQVPLRLLGEEVRPPDLSGIRWVKG